MAAQTKYYLCIRPDYVVGPHRLDALREWVHFGFLSVLTPACEEGEDAWITVEQIPKFAVYPKRLQERLAKRLNQPSRSWWTDPPSEEQLAKLAFFETPFEGAGLTKRRASQLIEYLASVDPERETAYNDRPASQEQRKRIRKLGGSYEDDYPTYGEAKYIIEGLELDAQEKDRLECDKSFEFARLEMIVNDDDKREVYEYKKLRKSEVQEFLVFLEQKWPDWRNATNWEVAKLVLDVFPHKKKITRRSASVRPASSSENSDENSSEDSGGGFTLFVALLIVVLVLFAVAFLRR